MLGFDAIGFRAIAQVATATVTTLTADNGAFTLSGQAAGLLYARIMPTDYGTFTLNGQAAELRIRTLEVGTFLLGGQTVAFSRTTRPRRTITRASTISLTRTTELTV